MSTPAARLNPGLNSGQITGRRWYVRPAVVVRRLLGAFATVGMVAIAACGGGDRQDANEPDETFKVDVTRATFPKQQRLAASTSLTIAVRNAGDKTIPDIAVTVDGFDYRTQEPDVADPARPRFAVNGVPRRIGGFPEAKDATPAGCDTAYVSTWACGPLKPGREKTFKWTVTPVKAGQYRITWRVAAGLYGKAKAESAGAGGVPSGSFTGTVSNAVPKVRVADDGKTVVTETP